MARKSKMNMKLIIGVILVIIVIIGGGYMLGLWGGNGGVADVAGVAGVAGNLTAKQRLNTNVRDALTGANGGGFRNYEGFDVTNSPICGDMIGDYSLKIFQEIDNKNIKDHSDTRVETIIKRYNPCTYFWYEPLIVDFVNSDFNKDLNCPTNRVVNQGFDLEKLTLKQFETHEKSLNLDGETLTGSPPILNNQRFTSWYLDRFSVFYRKLKEDPEWLKNENKENQILYIKFMKWVLSAYYLPMGFYLVEDPKFDSYKDRFFLKNYRDKYESTDDFFYKNILEINKKPSPFTESPTPTIPEPTKDNPITPIETATTFRNASSGQIIGLIKFKKIYLFKLMDDYLLKFGSKMEESNEWRDLCDLTGRANLKKKNN
jgi:hypothetical protein